MSETTEKNRLGLWVIEKIDRPGARSDADEWLLTQNGLAFGSVFGEDRARLIIAAPRLKEVKEALLEAATTALAMLRQQGRGNGRTAAVLEDAIALAGGQQTEVT